MGKIVNELKWSGEKEFSFFQKNYKRQIPYKILMIWTKKMENAQLLTWICNNKCII